MIVKVYKVSCSDVELNGKTVEWKSYSAGYENLSPNEWVACAKKRYKDKWGSFPLIFSFMELESRHKAPKIEVKSTVEDVNIPDDPITIEEYIKQFTMPKRAKELVKIKQKEVAIDRFDL